ncbi:hypothetical protein EP1X_09030 [Thermococcus sp. EP1]|uniref:hypothetical protein n=1 Tax=Thermococcus sp. EP1 TaxID=1591054 RepID=UPI0006D95449|nr:hypothetical protein [Thermococcus sp. EP1]KPU62402.1 hypothetical protein EP1X_09030 [Thermococcus sp. EP1]
MKEMKLLGENKRVLAMLSAFAFLLVNVALAVPVINLNVQNIGEGSAPVTSPVDNGNIKFLLNSTNPDYITGVEVSFDKDVSAGSTIYVKLYDNSSNLLAVGSYTINSILTAGSYITLTFPTQVQISQVENLAVVVQGP